jgi:3-oxoacyl-[acyl-carrier protein] reductase
MLDLSGKVAMDAGACCRETARSLRGRGGGGLVCNVTTMVTRHGGGPGASLFAGSKGFGSTVIRSMAKELVKDNIRVNSPAQSVIATPFLGRYVAPQMLENFRTVIPINYY